jgi:putative flippase GtrA
VARAGSSAAPRGGLAALGRLWRDERIAFLVVGGVNTVVGVAIFIAFTYVLRDRIGYMGVLVCSYAVAIVCAFTLQRTLVFRVRGHLLRDLARFTVVQLGALGVNAVLLPLLVEVAGVPVIPAQVIAVAISVVLTYTGHKLFSFRRSPAAAVPEVSPGTDGCADRPTSARG